MEKNNSDIGHNSNLLLEDALKETLRDAYQSSRAAGNLALKLWCKFSQVVGQCTELSDKQKDWNSTVDRYNDWVMQQDPNPATNKKRLRKKYKPRKLTNAELIKLHAEFEDDLQKLHELAEDPAAYLGGSEHPLLKEVTDEN